MKGLNASLVDFKSGLQGANEATITYSPDGLRLAVGADAWSIPWYQIDRYRAMVADPATDPFTVPLTMPLAQD